MNDLFSVIIVTYNNSRFLRGCIDSVLKQDYPNMEIIIADDHSEEFNCREFESYCLENRAANVSRVLVYQNERNLGTVRNINRALEQAEGQYFKVFAGDDELADKKSLTNAVHALLQSPDGIITSDVIKCDPEMNVLGIYSNRLLSRLNTMSPEECFAWLCVHNDIVDGGVFFTRGFLDRFGPFDESYILLEDWPMWLKVFQEGARIRYSGFPAIKYRTNVGFGTSVNPVYLADKKLVLEKVIIPSRKELGFRNYIKARLSFMLINSILIRRIYGMIFRRSR